MRALYVPALFLASASLVFGQLESNTLTIQSSRSIILQPDQIVFNVSVNSSPDATLDQVVASVQGSGITAADLIGVFSTTADLIGVFSTIGNPFNAPGPSLVWSFTLGVPLAKLKPTVASLTMLQLSIGKNNSGASLTFSVAGSRVSSELTQAQSCSLRDLVADAQVQAQKLAGAAGLTAGPIVAISDGSSGGVSGLVQFAQAPINTFRTGDFSVIPSARFLLPSTFFSVPTFASVSTPITCFAEVKFQLLRYQ